MSARNSIAALVLLGVSMTTMPAFAQEPDGDSFAALAYLRLPFSAKPYLGVAVQKDRIEASRPATRDYDTLWSQTKVIDVHLNPQTMEPVRVNGFAVDAASPAPRSADEIAWAAHIER